MSNQPITTLTCACCGTSCRGRQWRNRDTGYGVCSQCFHEQVKSSGIVEAVRIYGQRGVHHSLEAMNIHEMDAQNQETNQLIADAAQAQEEIPIDELETFAAEAAKKEQLKGEARNKRVIAAIEESIRHHKRLLARGRDERFGVAQCDLCLLMVGCRNCPILLYSGTSCNGTPYTDVLFHIKKAHESDTRLDPNCEECTKLEKEEIAFLEKVLEDYKKRVAEGYVMSRDALEPEIIP